MVNNDAICDWFGCLVSPLFIAKIFEEVQGSVAELIKDRTIIGHAIQNDLKVCSLAWG
jgi:DNA polymerase III epsilon subunit-like protein